MDRNRRKASALDILHRDINLQIAGFPSPPPPPPRPLSELDIDVLYLVATIPTGLPVPADPYEENRRRMFEEIGLDVSRETVN
jgi:hypothetical protein